MRDKSVTQDALIELDRLMRSSENIDQVIQGADRCLVPTLPSSRRYKTYKESCVEETRQQRQQVRDTTQIGNPAPQEEPEREQSPHGGVAPAQE
jgi:hypothetical protein